MNLHVLGDDSSAVRTLPQCPTKFDSNLYVRSSKTSTHLCGNYNGNLKTTRKLRGYNEFLGINASPEAWNKMTWVQRAADVDWPSIARELSSSTIVFPPYTGSANDLLYVRDMLRTRKDFNTYFMPPEYNNDNNARGIDAVPDSILNRQINSNPLMWKMATTGRFGTLPASMAYTHQTVLGKAATAIGTAVGSAAGAIVGMPSLGAKVGGAIGGLVKVKPIPIVSVPNIQPIASSGLTGLTGFRLFLKTYFGI